MGSVGSLHADVVEVVVTANAIGHESSEYEETDALFTRQRILNAARQVFIDVGYSGATYELISRGAGVTRPSVNYYFPDKADLYRQVVAQTNTVLVRSAVAEAQSESTLSAQLRAFAIPAVDADSRGHRAATFVTTSLVELLRHPELHTPDTGLADMRSFLIQAVEGAIQRGELAADTQVIAMADLLSALMCGIGLYSRLINQPDRLAGMGEQLHILLRGHLPDDNDSAIA